MPDDIDHDSISKLLGSKTTPAQGPMGAFGPGPLEGLMQGRQGPMPDPLTDAQLHKMKTAAEQLAILKARTTDGQWRDDGGYRVHTTPDEDGETCLFETKTFYRSNNQDTPWIALAHETPTETWVGALLAEVARLRSELSGVAWSLSLSRVEDHWLMRYSRPDGSGSTEFATEDQAIDELQRKAMAITGSTTWFSVKDRLPLRFFPCLVAVKGSMFPETADWDGEHWQNSHGYSAGAVTHWRPIPEPPDPRDEGS